MAQITQPRDDAATPRVRALLAEIAQLVDALARNGGDARIDLRSPPLEPADRAALEDVLGRGSVSARIDAEVTTDVRETHFPGVWWVSHHNPCGVLVAEFIEICVVPEILSAPAEDIARGLAELRANTAAGGAWSGCPPT